MPRVRSILEYAILLLALAALPTAQAQIKILSVVNSASFQAGLPAGGALATVFCTGLPTPPGTYTAPTSPPLPLYLAGVQVQVNSAVAPVLAVVIPQAGDSAPAQINFQVPLERNSTASTAVNSDQGTLFIRTVDASGVPNGAGSAVLTPVPNAGQGAFFQDANGYAIAFHNSDNAPVTVQNPAHAGETITAYADDLFLVWPPSSDRHACRGTAALPTWAVTGSLKRSAIVLLLPVPANVSELLPQRAPWHDGGVLHQYPGAPDRVLSVGSRSHWGRANHICGSGQPTAGELALVLRCRLLPQRQSDARSLRVPQYGRRRQPVRATAGRVSNRYGHSRCALMRL